MTKVINLFGGPGVGKSTTAAGLFCELKYRDIKCELVTEYAKDMTYENRGNILADQLYILAKQNRRVQRLVGIVDYIITDSPIIIGLMYMPKNYFTNFAPLVWQMFNSYNNINFFLNRKKAYQTYGRNQTEEEAKQIDVALQSLLVVNKVEHKVIDGGNNTAVPNILKELGIK